MAYPSAKRECTSNRLRARSVSPADGIAAARSSLGPRHVPRQLDPRLHHPDCRAKAPRWRVSCRKWHERLGLSVAMSSDRSAASTANERGRSRVYCVHRPWDRMIRCTRKPKHTPIAAANPPRINSSMQIRKARLEDIAEIESMIARSVMALMGREYSLEQRQASIGPLFGVDRQIIEDGTYYVVEHAGRLVGSGGWSFRRTLFGGDGVADRDDFPSNSRRRSRAHTSILHRPQRGPDRDRHANPFAKRDRCCGARVFALRNGGNSDWKALLRSTWLSSRQPAPVHPAWRARFPAHPYGKKPQPIARQHSSIWIETLTGRGGKGWRIISTSDGLVVAMRLGEVIARSTYEK